MAADLIAWVIVQDDAGRILLGRRDGTRFASGLWNLPGGAIEARERAAEAAARELREETGLLVNPAQLQHIGVNRYDVAGAYAGLHGRAQGVNFFFLARHWQGEPQPLENTSEVAWFDPQHLPPDSLPWLPRALEKHLLNGLFYTEDVE